MIEDIDIYRSAMVFIKKYNHQAKTQAALSALAHADTLNSEGLAVWCRIVSAIEDLQSTAPPSSLN